MGLVTSIKNLFSGATFSKLSATQEKAVVDALTYAMAVDRKITPVEEQELADALKGLDWKPTTPPESYVHESTERAKQIANQKTGAAEYCRDISKRLGEDWAREETYYMAARVAAADSKIDSNEQVLLSTMVEAFALDDSTQAKITDQVIREINFT